MDERDEVARTAQQIAGAIARRDLAGIRELLAPDFVYRTHGGAGRDTESFIAGIRQIPGEILAVKLEQLEVDMSAAGALVTGVQHARVRLGGQVVDDRRGFVDWFVKHAGKWRIQAAVDLPGTGLD
jgi:ketosteroid isomerase-like protein